MEFVTRRDFVKLAGSVVALGGCRLGSFLHDGSYSVAVLGDTHFDTEPESVYHSHYDESNKWAKIQHAEFRRNGEMWRERCPRLVAASAAMAGKEGAQFVLQLGDLVQGDCDDVPTHKKMLEDCVNMLRAPYPAGLPFLTVVGNHDFRGKGARPAYFEFIGRFMERETALLSGRQNSVEYPAFSFPVGGDVWVFCDFEMKDLNPVCDLIESATGARHIFLVTHGPFTTPPNGTSYRWRLGGRKESEESRRRLYAVLSRTRAIVLSGHTHTTNFYRHENSMGGFTGFTANSVWAKPELATAQPDECAPADYGMANLAAMKSEKRDDYRKELDFFRSSLKEYFFNCGAGHYRLEISGDGVTMAYYPGDSRAAALTFAMK